LCTWVFTECVFILSGLSDKESKALAFLTQEIDENAVVSFSGGKDSLVALDLALRVGVKNVIFCDTSIEFEETVTYVKMVADLYGFNLQIVKAPCDFFELIERITAPSRIQRWCCDVLKFGPLASWAYKNGVSSFITGLRSDESKSREAYLDIDSNPLIRVRQINPVIEWSEQDIWEYIQLYNLPANPLYEKFRRVGCWCCPFKSPSDWKIIEEEYPQKIQELHTALDALANRLGIKQKDEFVYNHGWTHWIHSTRKVTTGVNLLCQGGNSSDVIISQSDKNQIKRISKILPVLLDDFREIGNRLRISVPNNRRKRLEILIERALNCIGCGACLSYCVANALFLDAGSIAVDSDLCTHCHSCLDAGTIKGSCIARHYMPKRSALIKIESSYDIQQEAS
jgi:phosphoadenosine phosphosulfate reductase